MGGHLLDSSAFCDEEQPYMGASLQTDCHDADSELASVDITFVDLWIPQGRLRDRSQPSHLGRAAGPIRAAKGA